MKNFLILLLCVLSSMTVNAQKTPPTPIDLKAAYCIGYYKDMVSLFGSNFELLKNQPDLYKSHIEFTEKLKNDLQKLQGYLLPRTSLVYVEGLLAATNQYSKDEALTQSCNQKCPNDNNILICRSKCAETTGFNTRFKTCNDLTWMPY